MMPIIITESAKVYAYIFGKILDDAVKPEMN